MAGWKGICLRAHGVLGGGVPDVDRRGWIDEAFGSLVAAARVTVWHFPLRTLWTRSVDVLGWSRPVLFLGTALIILMHLTWLTLAAFAATRTLQRPVAVWKRLYPVAVVMAAAIWGVSLAESTALVAARDTLWTLADLVLMTNAAYTVLWIPAWVILRRRQTKSPPEPRPFWRRPGPWIWVSTWGVGPAPGYLV